MKTVNTAIPAGFSLQERDRRWDLARDIMRQRNLDVLIVYGDRESAAPAPFCVDHYFTNDRLGSVVIFYQDNDPVVVTFAPMMIADHMQAALRGDNQWLSPSQIMVGKTGRNIGALLREMNVPAAAQIGVIGLEPYPQAAIVPVYRDFLSALP